MTRPHTDKARDSHNHTTTFCRHTLASLHSPHYTTSHHTASIQHPHCLHHTTLTRTYLHRSHKISVNSDSTAHRDEFAEWYTNG